MQVGAKEWSFSLTKECLERETTRSATIREGPAQTSLKFRDQKTPITRRFACLCSLLHRWVHRNPPRAAASASQRALRVARVPPMDYRHKLPIRGSILDADRGSIFNTD